ncbi:MAG: hypothetical protein JO323_22745 [Acidobacteriia bacterium]|nr:hypothetical protein [Terriglobia bacterium]
MAAWIKGTELILWRNGTKEAIAANAAFPSLAALPDGGALVAWEENNGISVKKIR